MLNEAVVAHPWLLHNGYVDYQEIADPRSPLLPLVLSWLLPIFGYDAALSARTMHTVVVCFIALTTMLWAYYSSGPWALLATGVFLVTWSNFFGLWAIIYYDVVLAALFLLYFIVLAGQIARPAIWRLGAAGLITGCAVLIKQHAMFLVFPVAALLTWRSLSRQVATGQAIRESLTYLVGLALPLAVYAGFYYRQAGSFHDLIYWLVTINLTGPYASEAAAAPQPEHLRDMLPALWMLVPFIGRSVFPPAEIQPARGVRILLLAIFLLGMIPHYPHYSPRHWPVSFPFLALISGVAWADLMTEWQRLKAASLLLISITILLSWFVIALLIYIPRVQDNKPASSTEYSDLIPLAAALRERIPASGKVALVPMDEGNANLIYLLRRLPPRYWLLCLRWYLNPTTIERWLDAMEAEPPEIVLFFPNGIDLSRSAPQMLEYVRQHYQVVDAVPWGNRRRVEIMLRMPTSSP